MDIDLDFTQGQSRTSHMRWLEGTEGNKIKLFIIIPYKACLLRIKAIVCWHSFIETGPQKSSVTTQILIEVKLSSEALSPISWDATGTVGSGLCRMVRSLRVLWGWHAGTNAQNGHPRPQLWFPHSWPWGLEIAGGVGGVAVSEGTYYSQSLQSWFHRLCMHTSTCMYTHIHAHRERERADSGISVLNSQSGKQLDFIKGYIGQVSQQTTKNRGGYFPKTYTLADILTLHGTCPFETLTMTAHFQPPPVAMAALSPLIPKPQSPQATRGQRA